MKKITLCLIITLMGVLQTFSQEECGTLAPTAPEIYPDNPTVRSADAGTTFCINVKFHIVRNTDGTNGFELPSFNIDLDDILTNLNEYLNPHGIFPNNVSVNFINNTDFLNIDGNSEFHSLMGVDNDPNAINYYIVNKLITNGSSRRGAAKTDSNAFALKYTYVYSETSPHEFGHVLRLYHTHETDFGVEAINGSNCFTAGDLVCDTPADPKLDYGDDGNVNPFNCNYTGGNGYSPDTSNIMSYAASCRNNLTNGQGFRMRQALRYNSVLQNVVANSCTITDITIDGTDAICLNQNKTFSLQNLPSGLTPNWSTSSNLNLISSNTTDITVNLTNNTSENITITAKLTIGSIDYYISKNLTHLPVPSASSIELESFKSEPIYTNRWTNITARYNGLISEYNPNHRFEWKWVVPSHQIIQNSPFYSYIHVNPMTTMSSVYIKTQAENECGCSDWKGKWFNVVTPPSNCSTCPTNPGEVHY